MRLWLLEYILTYLGLFIAVLLTLVYLKNLSKVHKKEPVELVREPTVSVIIPAYNESEYIQGCLKSVLSLDYPKEKLEILVMDDGSTDDTSQKAQEIANKHSNIMVIRKKNSGKADSLNQAIKVAKGEMIACLDADSYVSTYSLRKILSLFTSDEVAAVSSAVRVRQARNIIEEVQRIEYLYALFSRKILNMLNSVTVTPGPFSIFRRSVLLKLGGFDTKSLVEDQEIALRMQKYGYSINCSTDSDIYTEIPHGFFDLMKQRTRWQRGGFWNAVRYANLIHPKYGDLGLIVIPFNLFSYFMLVAVIFISAYNMLTFKDYSGLGGWELILFSLSISHILFIVFIIILFFWFFYGMKKMFANEKFGIPSLLLYFLLYPIFTTIFWFSAAYAEIKSGGKFSW